MARLIPALALLLTAALAAQAGAQAPAEALADHAQDLAAEATADPAAFAGSAGSAERQQQEAAWARDWACGAVPIGQDLFEHAGACIAAERAAAGAEPQDASAAEADELDEADAAVADEVAAAQDLADHIAQDPTQAPGQLEVFVQRTVEALQGLLGVPGAAFDALAGAFGSVGGQAGAAGAALAEQLRGALDQGARAAGDAAQGLAHALGDLLRGLAQDRSAAGPARPIARDVGLRVPDAGCSALPGKVLEAAGIGRC
ncbi:MAG TPA: hypothetical protein VGR28_15285 [Candidatus Thermoplasmatota archaeon]|jgi:hypothetical protein|nr:hypothetical protein [Candidatus Thermoplasmatota archaeon]